MKEIRHDSSDFASSDSDKSDWDAVMCDHLMCRMYLFMCFCNKTKKKYKLNSINCNVIIKQLNPLAY